MRNRLLHWIPYRLLPDAAGYRLFQILYNRMAYIFPGAHRRSGRPDSVCPGSAALHIFFWHQRLPTPSGAPGRTPGSHPDRAIRNHRAPSVLRSASVPPGFPHFLPHGDSSSQRTVFLPENVPVQQPVKPATTPLTPSSASCSQSAVPVIALTCPG